MANTGRDLFERAQRIIPWGTQTNGKRPDPALGDGAPYFFDAAKGCKVRDTAGRWFIDYRSALGPIILGYNHPVVVEAVRMQLDQGVLFSLASPLEYEVAGQLTALIPGLEKVRFLKSGNEVNHAAIRLARAFTGREVIVTCGYHGHGDWFSCVEGAFGWPREGNGVPALLDRLVRQIDYGDVDALEQIFESEGNAIAGLIMVPYDWGPRVAHDFVHRARELTQRHQSVLIFDQILTGFRLGLTGAQGYFEVIPDITTYGKAIANGYPLAVFGGKAEVMDLLDRVMITTTHAGETLSLAAAAATLQVLETEPVLDHIWAMGRKLQDGFNEMASKLEGEMTCLGLPPALQFRFDAIPEKNRIKRNHFFRVLLQGGVFPSDIFLLNYAHDTAHIDATLEAMEIAMCSIDEG